jgi:hypothetical protein
MARGACVILSLAAVSCFLGARANAQEMSDASRSVAPAVPSPVECTASEQCADKDGYGEVCVQGRCKLYEDETDLFELLGLKKKTGGPLEPFKVYLALFPAVGYAPANGLVIGVYGQLGMFLGNPETTTISNLKLIGLYTTMNQLIFQVGLVAMSAENEWELQGDYRLLFFNQDTYGLSTAAAAVSNGFSVSGIGTTAAVPGAQPMDFDLVRVHQAVLKRVWGSLYLGGAYILDHYWNIKDVDLNLTVNPPVLTSHYAYSGLAGFNPLSYTISGVAADVLYDSRDSTINAYRGVYANLAFELHPTWLGSSQESTLLFGEFRTYLGLSAAVPRNVLAFWLYMQGVTSGNMPYLTLPSIGWDLNGTTGRGYIQGRFRGTGEVYAEAEWRFRITDGGFLGGAVFANIETFSRPEGSYGGTNTPPVNLFEVVRPAGGVGLRFMMSRESRSNIRLDVAGGYNSFAVYFGSGEAF